MTKKIYKSKRVQGTYGKVRIIEDWGGYSRLYVKRTSLATYVVSMCESMTLDSMISIAGGYHFGTLAELHSALNADVEE